jgi:TM2 domain-containing membrane protein YozV
MEDVGKFLVHLVCFAAIWYVYFMAIGYIFWLLGTFFRFWCVVARKIWQPCAAEPSFSARKLN